METHILCKHKILDGIIPSKEELTVKPGNDPKRGLEELSEEVLANSANSKRFKCPMCPIEKTKSVALLKHLTMDHYKEELRSMYGARDEWMCGECNKSFQNEDQLISHLVTFHKALKNLMVLFDDKNNQTANSVTIFSIICCENGAFVLPDFVWDLFNVSVVKTFCWCFEESWMPVFDDQTYF